MSKIPDGDPLVTDEMLRDGVRAIRLLRQAGADDGQVAKMIYQVMLKASPLPGMFAALQVEIDDVRQKMMAVNRAAEQLRQEWLKLKGERLQ